MRKGSYKTAPIPKTSHGHWLEYKIFQFSESVYLPRVTWEVHVFILHSVAPAWCDMVTQRFWTLKSSDDETTFYTSDGWGWLRISRLQLRLSKSNKVLMLPSRVSSHVIFQNPYISPIYIALPYNRLLGPTSSQPTIFWGCLGNQKANHANKIFTESS